MKKQMIAMRPAMCILLDVLAKYIANVVIDGTAIRIFLFLLGMSMFISTTRDMMLVGTKRTILGPERAIYTK
jgi:hypothetical protein